MAESASGEKDPYMQAYITARMKNQVEEMKLQKLLSTMEVSQRVKKIMINLELFEDRKRAHKLQQEMMKMSKRHRKPARADRHLRTAKWTSSLMTSEHAHSLANSSSSAGLQFQSPPHLRTDDHAVYPVTKVKEFGSAGDARRSLPEIPPGTRGPSAQPSRQSRLVQHNSMPMIQVTDCNGDGVTVVAPPPSQEHKLTADGEDPASSAKEMSSLAWEPASAKAGTTVPAPTKTTTIITPPPLSASHRGQPSRPSRPATEPTRRSVTGSVSFPPVVRARSTRTRCTRSTLTARTHEEHKRLNSASNMWPGDPRAICSVRRERRNVDEMLAVKKAGEETRRLIREATLPCSRNCNKPNIISMLEKTYVNLPELLPEIEKARKRLNGEIEETSQQEQDRLPLTSAERRRHGRFDLEQEQEEGTKELPVYKIDYGKLREMGGTRRNSVLA